MNLEIIILAAGKGTRMYSELPKALQPLAGISLLEHVINTAKSLQPQKVHVVYGSGGKEILEKLGTLDVNWILQEEQLGTGHAVMQVLPQIETNSNILILYCDVPLISKNTLQKLLNSLASNSLSILTAHLNNPQNFGRILRDEKDNIKAIVEQKDATPLELAIREINSGIFAGKAEIFKKYLLKVKPNNAQKEYYLTDIVKLAVEDDINVEGISIENTDEILGVNNKVELAHVERIYQRRIAEKLMQQGVTLIDPSRFDVRGNGTLSIANDVVIDVNVIFEGNITIGAFAKIGPNVILKNSVIGKNVEIRAHSVVEGASIDDNCVIGPFARVRPDSKIGKNARVGNFVELKNTKIGEGSKASHLSYLGDAVIGDKVNIGAGVITCNYDGVNKSQTIIENGAFIGSDSQLIAPVKVGENAYVGSGSTITEDAPPGKLTIARARQVTVEKWKKSGKNN